MYGVWGTSPFFKPLDMLMTGSCQDQLPPGSSSNALASQKPKVCPIGHSPKPIYNCYVYVHIHCIIYTYIY